MAVVHLCFTLPIIFLIIIGGRRLRLFARTAIFDSLFNEECSDKRHPDS